MTKEDCQHKVTWDFNGYKVVNNWFKTLLIQIRLMEQSIIRSGHRGNALSIQINQKLEGVLALSGEYDRPKSLYARKLKVIIDNELPNNIIFVTNYDVLKNLELIPMVSSSECIDGVVREKIKNIRITNLTQDEIDKYVRCLKGCIEIQNYA
jgi:hypothetical protein